MEEVDLYKDLQLDRFFQGLAKIYSGLNINIKSNPDVLRSIDNICLSHGFIALNEEWKELTTKEAEDFFISSLRFNIGFTNHENMPEEKAKNLYHDLTKSFNLEGCKVFTNWYNNPWTNNEDPTGINTISDATLDLALVIVDENKLLFYFISFED